MKYICTKCFKNKKETEYNFRENNYRRRQCKACCYENNRKNYKHEQERNRKLKQKFGIDNLEYQRLLEKQKGVCGICFNEQKVLKRNRGFLSVDHNHKTGKIRGLLCGNCNRAIGLLYDNTKLLKQAIKYLKTY